jgi:hypothetical protein
MCGQTVGRLGSLSSMPPSFGHVSGEGPDDEGDKWGNLPKEPLQTVTVLVSIRLFTTRQTRKEKHKSVDLAKKFPPSTRHPPAIHPPFTRHSPAIHPPFTRHSPAIHPPFTRHSPACSYTAMQSEHAVQSGNAAACRLYRQRKREHQPTRKRRSASELVALDDKPLAERTDEEKESVRNHRKELKRKEKRAAAVAAVPAAAVPSSISAAPPPTRSPSPQRDISAALSPLPPAPVHHDSLLLHTADLEDILGRPLTPPTMPAAAAASTARAAPPLSSLPLPSPPPASVSPSLLFDEPYDPFTSPSVSSSSAAAAAAAAAAHPIPPAPSTSAAAASAMSSASKLRSSILKKRAAMSILNPNVKRRPPPSGIKIGEQEKEDDEIEQDDTEEGTEVRLEDMKGKQKEEQEWESLIQTRADRMFETYLKKRGNERVNGEYHRARIHANIRLWINAARTRGCTGTEDGGFHAPTGCPGPFTASSFFDHTQFAHWKKHKRSSSGQSPSADKLYNVLLRSSTDQFARYMTGPEAHGRVLWVQCHHAESRQQMMT